METGYDKKNNAVWRRNVKTTCKPSAGKKHAPKEPPEPPKFDIEILRGPQKEIIHLKAVTLG
jgi:hypothetical protein